MSFRKILRILIYYKYFEVRQEIIILCNVNFNKYRNIRTTIDNLKRVFSSFFGWLEDEDYIAKSPARRIHKVKTLKVVKEIFTDENIEKMRENCKNVRDLVIIEMLISTGVRVSELTNLNKSDINFQERSCVVLGKGNKQM